MFQYPDDRDYDDADDRDYDDVERGYDEYGVCDISCAISTVIWGQCVQYAVDKHHLRDNEYSLYVSINENFDVEDIGQGFQGRALESLRRGLAIGVARWVYSIPLADGLYHISMYNTETHAKGFAKLAKRLGFKKTFGDDYGFLGVIKNGKPCRWRTRYSIIKLRARDLIDDWKFRAEDNYYLLKHKLEGDR
jgi:hypothetical protein